MTPPIMRGGYRSRKRNHRPWFLFCNTKPPVRRVVLCYTKQRTAGLSLSSPVRVFEDVTGWGGSTAEERANNIKDGNYLKNTYYEYGNVQAANREVWIAEKMR